jgi:Tfp pilus assembly protein PilP
MGNVMIFKRPNTRCNETARREVLLLGCVSCAVFFSLNAFASNINKPASPVMEHAVGVDVDGGRGAISKSRVVPLKRKMDLATSTEAHKINKQNRPEIKSQRIAQTVSTQPNKKVESTEAKTNVKAGDVKHVSATPKDGETWDSAATRYDQSDPAKSVTKGVRVEDIIEPTIDYRYSSARRKNPFIPEVILSGKAARQRELSPNDVEIPIVSPLQAFAVARLAVIGVWETDNGIWKALIRTPATQGIEAKLGDPIGNSGGRLMTINPDSVVVREFSVRSDGTREYRDIPLYMGSDLPAASDDKVGGRLILRPGASQPEIIAPQADLGNPTDSVISASPAVVGGDKPGTLKTVETQSSVPASSNMPSSGPPAQVSPTNPGADTSSFNSPMAPSGSFPSQGPTDNAPPSVPINPEVKVQSATPVMGGEQ